MKHLERAQGFFSDLVEIRRDLHRHPELSFQERRTASVAAERVSRLGFSVQVEVGITGVVAEIGSGEGPVVALRADMDALPIQEDADHDYVSQVPGVMHACGHDMHTAGLIGAARLLAEDHAAGALPPGRVRLLFQPSEETPDSEGKSGAMRMVDDGAMEGVAGVVGLHVGAHLPTRKTFFHDGTMMAGADHISVEVGGQSSHAARPNEGIDALVLAAQGVVACQQVVARHLSPMESGVVTFGRIEGGVASNVLAERVSLEGTLRYFEETVRERLHKGIRGAFASAEAQGGSATVEIQTGYPPVVNDSAITEIVRKVAIKVLGKDSVLEAERMMGAEDFAILAEHAPGTFFWLGAALPDPREHHHSRFDVDESVLPMGAAILAGAASRLLSELA
jgi:IAA-amino acid hydrolase